MSEIEDHTINGQVWVYSPQADLEAENARLREQAEAAGDGAGGHKTDSGATSRSQGGDRHHAY